MKNILLLLLFFSWSQVGAQVGLRLDRTNLHTDQPGVVFITTNETDSETSIHFSQVFQCARFQGYYCATYLEETTAHDIELHFHRVPVGNVHINFSVVFDVTQGEFLFKVNSSSYSNDQFIIDRQARKTIITIKN